jgi:putative DNA primase/helicase
MAPGRDKPTYWEPYQKRAPTEKEYDDWFDPSKPDANVGHVVPPGIIVVDLDGDDDADDGHASAKRAEAMLNALGVFLPENAPRVKTGKGYQIILRAPLGTPTLPGESFVHSLSATGKPCKPYVEILANGRYGILPPSIHPRGMAYEWAVEPDGPIPEAPPELLGLIKAKSQPSKKSKAGKATASKNPDGWVDELLSQGCVEGTINPNAMKLAGYFARLGVPEPTATLIICNAFNAHCVSKTGKPFKINHDEVATCAKHAHTSEMRKVSLEVVEKPIDQSEFKLLGYSRDASEYFYLPRTTGIVVSLTSKNHDEANLLRLATQRYWESKYANENGMSWRGARQNLLNEQHKVGIFVPSRIRGRGAWWDDDAGAVMHAGDRLLSGDKSIPIKDAKSRTHIYQLAEPLDVALGTPMNDDDALAVMDIFESLSWDHPHKARLAVGWCVCAVVCGALEWRPHVWFTGPSGAGKSWVIDNLVRRLIGNLALVVQSETTEAGLRQTLGHDARPVIFDEAEADGARGELRMANVLGLIRQASSETGGTILKGGADGTARSYMIRSCFAMSSIQVSVNQQADKNRVSTLDLQIPQGISQDERNAKFKAIREQVALVLTDSACAAFRARCVAMIPTIRENARVFSTVASSKIGSRRLGDQIGTLLAGAYALLSPDVIDAEHAGVLIDDQDLSQQKDIQQSTDERELMDHILQHVVRVIVSRGQADRTIATLLKTAHGNPDPDVSADVAASALSLLGIRAMDEGFVVANSHKGVKKVLEGTHWSKDWGRVLKRIGGATSSGVHRIGDVACRGTLLPWDATD